MSSLVGIMDVSLSAMFAARVGLQTVSHNIANANTPGYSRQSVILGTRLPDARSYGFIGRGVAVEGVRRYTDTFLTAQYQSQSSTLASYEQIDSTLKEIEGVFGSVDNDHLGDAITAFFNAWSQISNAGSENSVRASVVSTARNLAADFRSMSNSLDALEGSLDDALVDEIASLNDLFDHVALLNQQITSGETTGIAANEVRDRRDYIINQISELTQISTIERTDGSVDVILAGRTMVSHDTATHVERAWEQAPGSSLELHVYVAGSRVELDLSEGRIQGLYDSYDVHVNDVRANLDDLAALISERVNELHLQGRSGSSSGRVFFVGEGASAFAVNQALVDDPNLVVTSRSGLPGDNDLALEIAALPDTSLTGEAGGNTLRDDYRTLLIELASDRARFEFLVDNQQNIVAATESRLSSIRDVSIDEEAANMIQLQNSYDAAARVVTVVQEMFDTLLTMV